MVAKKKRVYGGGVRIGRKDFLLILRSGQATGSSLRVFGVTMQDDDTGQRCRLYRTHL